ncbi:helix-turn-helix transcriptional regulator [Mycobacterium paraterrae]|uniref:Helix-turn-helix transcriptional regulator n=1 Tax=Mycobacterium paraterrae TaxID=577492 RepID=A0ABY3VMI9_9MYCO|nr:helix-turn-helix transcriptional regulator [Mycobacterium paraterrae]UMB70650.1 helix-turn-helix transcriptional regulator [Mycobacterium paraterrae]
MTVLLDTTDLGEAEQILSASCARQRHSAPAEALTGARVVRSQIGSLIVDDIEFSYDLSTEPEPLADIVLRRVHSGFIAQQFPERLGEKVALDEVTAVGARNGFPSSARVFKARYDALTVSRSVLRRVAVPAVIEELTSKQSQSTISISPAANDHLVKTIDYVRKGVMRDPFAAQNPLIISAVEDYLAATVLAAFPDAALHDSGLDDHGDGTPSLLRRAIAFIDDHAHRDISVVDIAESIYVTPRALQYMFRRHRDCTPMEYLRRVRLHHAHLELVAADRHRTTVGQVAARWGFGHLGRFAVYYRAQYGQSPHVTLRE